MQIPEIIAFQDGVLVAEGSRSEVALAVKRLGPQAARVLVLNAAGQPVELDLRGAEADILARLAESEPRRGPGRPKLGVVAREVTLLPRHWDGWPSSPAAPRWRCGG